MEVDSIDLFSMDEIPGDDLQAMVTCVSNLIEYLNINYINDETIKEEVEIMAKSLFDKSYSERVAEDISNAMSIGMAKGSEKTTQEHIRGLLPLLDDKSISEALAIDIELVKQIRRENTN